MKVEKRIVSRWFVNGKGYATETAAYLAAAKEELSDAIRSRVRSSVAADDFLIDDDRNRFHEAFAEMFPNCDHPDDCVQYCWPRGFCNAKRWEWLRAKAKELKEADHA